MQRAEHYVCNKGIASSNKVITASSKYIMVDISSIKSQGSWYPPIYPQRCKYITMDSEDEHHRLQGVQGGPSPGRKLRSNRRRTSVLLSTVGAETHVEPDGMDQTGRWFLQVPCMLVSSRAHVPGSYQPARDRPKLVNPKKTPPFLSTCPKPRVFIHKLPLS